MCGVVIVSFGDSATSDIFHGIDSKAARAIPKAVWGIARRKLDMIDAAHELKDLATPPGNRLEKLRGSLAGFYSIRVNDQFRAIFRFASGSAADVTITDYH